MENYDIQAVIDLTRQTAQPFELEGTPALLVPGNASVELFNNLRASPPRVDQKVTLETPGAFIQYFNEFCGPNSAIFCTLREGIFCAILDYHGDTPSWCSHLAIYTCPKTPEWALWEFNSGVWMPQERFAAFIEENQEEILEPTGAEMLEIALSLQANSHVNFRRAIRLDNGQIQFQYQEEIDGQAGTNGQLQIPALIKVGLQLFEESTGYEIEARFRYRIKDTKLTLSYELIRPHKAVESAVKAVYDEIDAAMREGRMLRGSPS